MVFWCVCAKPGAQLTGNEKMEKVIECIAKNNLHESLVRCWRMLDADFPSFQEQEQAARDQGQGGSYRTQKESIDKAIWSNEPLRMRNLLREYPLAFLEVLDDYLFHCRDYRSQLSTGVLLDGETYFVHKRVLKRSENTAHGSKTGHMQSWLRHHWIVPASVNGIEIRLRSAPECIQKAMEEGLKDGKVKVHVGSFPDEVKPLWLNDDPTKLSARELTDPDKRWQGILEVLGKARGAGASILVLPELTVCPALREKVIDWLDDHTDHGFILLLPGSFHEEKNGEKFNIAELFNCFGKTVLHHRKLTRYGDSGKQEDIRTGSRIELLDTSIGLIGIPICLDFCEEGAPLGSLWERIGAEWLLVPAFGAGSSINAHLRRAEELFRMHGTVSVIANQNPEGSDRDHGFVCHLAGKKPRRATRNRRNFLVNIEALDSDM
jgi:predicted amidohydrolase